MTTSYAQNLEAAPDLRRWHTALVYGLGVSGRAAVRLLARRGVRTEAVDRAVPPDLDRELPELSAVHREDRLVAVPSGVDAVVLSPGVSPSSPLVEDARRRAIPVVAEVEMAYQMLREQGPDSSAATVVAVTGSNGKSTTTALTGALLAAADRDVRVCGNIGVAFSEAVLEAELDAATEDRGEGSGCVFVVELSSFQTEGLHTFHPRAAAYLNLSPDHMDRYPSVQAYAAAKERLLSPLGGEDTAVLNLDDERSATAATRARKRFFSRLQRPRDGCFLYGERVIEIDPRGDGESVLFERSDLKLAGEHNLENAMAAALLARALGVDREAIQRGLAGFSGLPHRMERVAERGGVVFWNDSKGTNPSATLRSLEGMPDGSVHLILGGRAKGTDFRDMAPLVRRKARRLYLIGEAAGEIGEALEGAAPASRCGTLADAVAEAAQTARPGDSVLLSPACASFDQFRDFVHRGEEFRRLVAALVADIDRKSTPEGRDGDQAGG